jgi:hypothetical protein
LFIFTSIKGDAMTRNWMMSIALVMAVIGTAGCAGSAGSGALTDPKKSPLYAAEKALGTDTDNNLAYHALVHYPTEHALRYPGLIIGVEKSASPLLAEARDPAVLNPLDPQSKSDKWLGKKLTSDMKVMFISHVVRTPGDGSADYRARKPCFLYNGLAASPAAASHSRTVGKPCARYATPSGKNCGAPVPLIPTWS